MNVVSYKHYLALFEEKPAPLISKIALSLLSLSVLFAGIFLVIFYQYAKEAPLRIKYQYLQSISIDFNQSNQSLKEVLSEFKVAGAKVQFVETLKEKTGSEAAFFAALDDLEKSASKIESAQNNLLAKKETLLQKAVPGELLDLNSKIIDFYERSSAILSTIQNDHLFAKQLLLASGPKFYLPKLTDDQLWERADKEEIIAYYKSQKDEANTALANLAKLTPASHFQNYYDAQIAYLALLVNLSDNIINTLSVADEQDLERATQIEKSYQLLVRAKRENETIEKKLLQEKLNIVDIEENLNKLAPIEMSANSLVGNLNLLENSTPKPQAPDPRAPFRKILANSLNFLQGLQIPTSI